MGKLDKTVLLPGEETDVTLTWNGVSVTNDFAQGATIYTNAPDSPEVKIKVRGQVARVLSSNPENYAGGYCGHRHDHVARSTYLPIWRRPKSYENFRWTDARSADKVKLDVKKVELDAQKFPEHPNAIGVYEVEVTIEPGLNLGLLNFALPSPPTWMRKWGHWRCRFLPESPVT